MLTRNILKDLRGYEKSLSTSLKPLRQHFYYASYMIEFLSFVFAFIKFELSPIQILEGYDFTRKHFSCIFQRENSKNSTSRDITFTVVETGKEEEGSFTFFRFFQVKEKGKHGLQDGYKSVNRRKSFSQVPSKILFFKNSAKSLQTFLDEIHFSSFNLKRTQSSVFP